ncbi:uridine kinase [Marinomonas mediterranea]|uniref:uridine kinase n=1 Tax=Marinomonas mediterranea TaxID=119864 RepID=UPI00234A8690|nr:uridine kinase [Marinomonas mediterranea]WCN07531.1 uridine kinase [Marinomonas mediterranea]WCN11629.1 uridine kinase [Marinomonas mediterranea]
MSSSNQTSYLQQLSSTLDQGEQYWIGLVGAPGSGKSTFAANLKDALGDRLVVIPMDGYHLYCHQLDQMPNREEAYRRRGAPFTFDAVRLVLELVAAKHKGFGVFPSFDHHKGDPIENDIELKPTDQIVLVEGNYLLLNEEPWNRLKAEVFDETWFLDVPIDVSNQRVAERHIKTGLTAPQAWQRVTTNDGLNAELIIEASREKADRLV